MGTLLVVIMVFAWIAHGKSIHSTGDNEEKELDEQSTNVDAFERKGTSLFLNHVPRTGDSVVFILSSIST